MAEVKVDFAAIERLAKQKGEAGLRQALGKAESLLKGTILNQPGTGRVYTRGGVKHQASAPGQPPAPDTTNLRTSTNADPALKEDGQDIVGSIVAATNYAEALERGTERMAARPFLGPLATEYFSDLQKAFVDGAKG